MRMRKKNPPKSPDENPLPVEKRLNPKKRKTTTKMRMKRKKRPRENPAPLLKRKPLRKRKNRKKGSAPTVTSSGKTATNTKMTATAVRSGIFAWTLRRRIKIVYRAS